MPQPRRQCPVGGATARHWRGRLLLLATCLLTACGGLSGRPSHGGDAHGQAVAAAAALVEAHFVDPVSREKLAADSIEAMLRSIDPHAVYLEAGNAPGPGCAGGGRCAAGIGVHLARGPAGPRVVAVFPGAPADVAGLRRGDVLLEIDGVAVSGVALAQVLQALRGDADSVVRVRVARPGSAATQVLSIARQRLTAPGALGVETAPGILHIQVPRFVRGSAAAIRVHLESTVRGGEPAGVVLDLRDNPGGLLEEAVAAADLFLDHVLVVSVVGRSPGVTQQYRARAGTASGAPLVVLVNDNTASAAEVVAGALGHYRRAQVAGEKTRGKGSVQSILPLGRRGAIKLTTARYVLPGDYLVEGRGIVPDIALACADASAAVAGQDCELERAIGLLRSGEAPPV